MILLLYSIAYINADPIQEILPIKAPAQDSQ